MAVKDKHQDMSQEFSHTTILGYHTVVSSPFRVVADRIMASTKRIVTVADLHRSLVTTDKLHIDLVVPGTEVIHKPFPWVFGLAINPSQLKEIVDCSQFADKVHIDLAVEKTVVIRMLLFPPMGPDLVISHLWIVK